MSFNQLLSSVKENAQDFEWYPTDTKILDKVAEKILSFKGDWRYSRLDTFLDIGAGNGKVLDYFSQEKFHLSCYGIEKSNILMSSWNKNYSLLGCDFHKTTLLDKKVDIIFCNPPYKEYEEWTIKIINESNAELIYLVLPERWENNDEIKRTIKNRKCEIKKIFWFDFANAEDRTARAKVDVIEVRIEKLNEKDDSPFNRFFKDNFKYPEKSIKLDLDDKVENTKVVNKTNLIETLDFLYQERMRELFDSYKSVCSLPYDLLQEFNLTRDSLIASLEMKINSAKKEYWQRLFDGMKTINSRLTSASRQKIVSVMNAHTGIEFNRENAYAIVLWVIKNCNIYFDEQFLDLYGKMIDFCNIESYKSNQRVFTEDQFCYWNRYNRNTVEYYKLKTGNRIVLEHCGGISKSIYSFDRGLDKYAREFIEDLLVIARNLNFEPDNFHGNDFSEWTDSGARNFYCVYKTEKRLLFSVRAYKNGNMHFSFNNNFIHAINIMHGKLKGWINDAKTAEEESTPEMAKEYFDYNLKIEQKQLMLQ